MLPPAGENQAYGPIATASWSLTILAVLAATCPAAAERLRFEHLTPDDGLTNGIVMTILQDHVGFMWFGTWAGLDRYDGYEILNFQHQPDEPGSLSGNEVKALLEDREGTLWVATNGGLSRFDRHRQRFTNYLHDPEDPHSLGEGDVWSLLEDSDGVLWMSTQGGGLNRLQDADSGRFVRYRHDPENPSSLSSDSGRGLAEDHLGYLWIGTPDRGLNRLDRTTGEVRRYRHDPEDPTSLSGDDVWSIFEDHRQELWIGTRTHGLNRYDRQSERFLRYPVSREDTGSLAGGFVIDLLEDRDDNLWLAIFDAGLHRYDRDRDRFVRYLPDPVDPYSLSLFQTTSLFEDELGALWIGTFGNGVDRVDRDAAKFEVYEHHPGDPGSLAGKDVRVVHENGGGVLWIGTYDGGLTRFDRQRDSYSHYRHDADDRDSLSDNRIQTLAEDGRGRLWIGTWGGGLNRFDPRRPEAGFRHFRHRPDDPGSLGQDDVRGLYIDIDGDLWVGTQAAGVNRFDAKSETFERFPPDAADPQRIDKNYIFTLVGSPSREVLWLGMWGSGLNVFDLNTGKVRRYKPDARNPEAISGNDVWSVYEQRDGTVWLGTSGGLDRFDPDAGVFHHFGENEGLKSESVHDIVEDEDGNLWFSTNTGLTRFNPDSGEIRHYDPSDGVAIGNLFDGCAYRSTEGEIFFGGKKGLLYFRPEEVSDNPYAPPVVLTDFRIFNQTVPIAAPGSPLTQVITETESLTLDHSQSVVTFAFSALNYRAAEKNRYAYKLVGFEEDWNEVEANRRYATYTNLDPGQYRFLVRASNNDGVWSPMPRALAIRVLPPIWDTWWFRALAVVLVGSLVWSGFLLRTARIRARNRKLQAEIRERRRVEEQREQLISELNDKNELLEAQKAELERFTYTVSHDLKTPLVTIQGFLGLLERDMEAGETEAVHHDVATIGAAAAKMHQLLEDLLDLSRVGRVVSPPEPVALTELAQEAVGLAAAAVCQGGIEVAIQDSMPEVCGDRVRLREVLQNLVANAAKFMGQQASPRIEIGARANGSEIVCHVRDNGVGIEPRYHEKVFALFERLDPTVEGTGVGLTLVKRIIEVHGGRIWIESTTQKVGTTFFFTLPQSV